jgi:tRNA threonylcarbamoyladenosine biosynthesis protein TsaB
MPRILCIETATPVCSVALVEGAELAGLLESTRINSHSEVITVFIEQLLSENKLKVADLDAIAISMGPGSYTGLRIGVSTAKGLCYAADKPLIAIGTLQSMFSGMRQRNHPNDTELIFCPMIDARRMEVYSALFDFDGHEIRETHAEVIDENSFSDLLDKHHVVFFGDGAGKCKTVIKHSNALFDDKFYPSAAYMMNPAIQKFEKKQFEDVAYFEPFYLKDFIAGIPKVKGLK